MSYDLAVFDKTKAPKFYEDFLEWLSSQTQWKEKRDYNSIEGTSPALVSWFMKMKDTFPPLNGEYSPDDEELINNDGLEDHLTDYSIASGLVYGSFGWSVAEEANHVMKKLAREYNVGFYDFQTGEVISDSMIVGQMRTEGQEDKPATWEKIENEIQTLDSPERGTSPRNNAFLTIWFKQNGTDDEFMQCMPQYPQQKGLFQKLFRASRNGENTVTCYIIEISIKEKIYQKQVTGKEELRSVLRQYYETCHLPDISGWAETGII